MEENRGKLVAAGRKAFPSEGLAASSMELTASVGLMRRVLPSEFRRPDGLLAAVVAQVDGEMATRARLAGADYL